MRQAALIALWLLYGSNAALAGTSPYGDIKLSPAERVLVEEHVGKRLGYHQSIERSTEFPEVLRIVRYIDDAGPRTEAMIAAGAWVDWSAHGTFWIPEEATRHVLQARGWSTLDEGKRKTLALRWVIDALPPGYGAQSAADGGHAPDVSVDGGDVVVRIWLSLRFTSIAGPRVTRDQAPHIFRFKPDGSMAEEPAGAQPPH